MRRVFWTESPYHNKPGRPKSLAGRCLARLLVMALSVITAGLTLVGFVRYKVGELS